MLSLCLKCRKNTETKKQRVGKTNKGKLMLLVTRVVCNSKKFRFFKEQETSGLLRSLGIRIPLIDKIQILA